MSRIDPRIALVLREMMMRQMVSPARGTFGSVDAMPYPVPVSPEPRTLEEVLRRRGGMGGVRG